MKQTDDCVCSINLVCHPGTTVYWLQFFPKNHKNRFSPLIREGKVDSIVIRKNFITYVVVTASKTEIGLHQKDFFEKWFLFEEDAKNKIDELREEMIK